MENESLRLRGSRWFSHFFPAIYFVLPVLILAAIVFVATEEKVRFFALIAVIALTLLGILTYRIQHRKLKYERLSTSRDAEANFDLVRQVADEAGWVITFEEQGSWIEAHVAGFPKTLLSWGEMVTVRFNEGDVWINSICDPDRFSSVISGGRNRTNVACLVRALNDE